MRSLNPIATKPPSLCQGIRFYPVGADKIAHVTETNAVVYLNHTAQALLELCDGSHSADEICRSLSRQFALTPNELCDDVASTLGCFALEKLVQTEGSIFDDLSSLLGDRLMTKHLRFGDCTLRVQSTSRHIPPELDERYQHLQSPPTEPVQMTLDIIPLSGSDYELAYVQSGGPVFAQSPAKGTVDLLKMVIVNAFQVMATDCVWFHSGAVAKNGFSAIVMGSPGSGKSSVTNELCRRGWDYLSDEVLPITISPLQTVPFPLTPFPRQSAGAVLPNHRLSEIPKQFTPLPAERIARRHSTPAAVFLPCYSPGETARLEPLDSGAAAMELLNHCISLPMRATQAIKTVANLVDRVCAYRLSYGNASAACDQIERAMAIAPPWSAQT